MDINNNTIAVNERKYDFVQGETILFNKPLRWTSFDIVKRSRNIIKKHLNANKIKVGHAGTLDPLATGLLIVCTGKLTRKIDELQGLEKEYTGIITIGGTTLSYDSEMKVNETFPYHHITEQQILDAAHHFEGTSEQIPPSYSALNISGERAYQKARRGETVIIPAKKIVIHQFEITKINIPDIHFRIVCSKGTYIRTIAFDFGKYLCSGAYLSALCRTRIGNYLLEDSITIDEFQKINQNEGDNTENPVL